MKKLNLKYGLVALMAMGISANVNAQDELPCSDVTFNAEGFAAYEFIDQACQGVVDRDGEWYVKMIAQVVSQSKSAGTRIRFKHADGTWGPAHLAKHPEFVTQIDGRDVRISDLATKQDVRVYFPADLFAVNEEVEDVVAVEVAEDVVAEDVAVAEIVEEEEAAPVVLPTTAGPLPWLALFGSLFLMLGGALRLSRKQ